MISTSNFQVAFHWFMAVNISLHEAISKAWLSNNSSLYYSDSMVILSSKQPETQNTKVCVSHKTISTDLIVTSFQDAFTH